jgi:hypothetical protein
LTNSELNERNLPAQIARTEAMWEQFAKHGVTEETELLPDFFYYSRSKQNAEALRKFIVEELGYATEVKSEGNFLRPKFSIIGQATPMKVSLDILRVWTTRMNGTGSRFDCEFDGWGAAVP